MGTKGQIWRERMKKEKIGMCQGMNECGREGKKGGEREIKEGVWQETEGVGKEEAECK